ncbi:hypothetical protein [Umezawaea sp. NPDC059074]|uniref:phage adaptor protein n=1 Tax=Umezawaea sp. NPDC059074 TaxID=3346716 RepID=UPI00367FF834
MVERVRSNLNQNTTTFPQVGTFKGWVLNGSNKVGVQLADIDVADKLNHVIVELGHELVYVTSYDPTTGAATCPPWFRQRMGSPANDAFPPDSMVTIDPRWTWWSVAQAVVAGISACQPDLFAVKTTTLTTDVTVRRYLLPADVENILSLKVRLPGSEDRELPVKRYSLDTKAADGNRYLHMAPVGMSGLPVYVTYRADPAPLSPSNPAGTWASTGLPATAEDIPVLWATATLLPAAEAARTQTASIEQSDRARFIQTGSATSVARVWTQQFQARLAQERHALLDTFSARPHFEMNG